MLRRVMLERRMLRRVQQRGSAFIYVVGAVSVASVIAVGYLVTADNGRERSAREVDATVKEIDLEERILAIKQGVEQQALASAQVNLDASLASSAGLPATFSLQAEHDSGSVVSLDNFASASFLQEAVPLSMPGDPFAGARARVESLNLKAQTDNHDVRSSRVADKRVTENPQIDLRQIPISEFTLYVADGVSRLSSQSFAPDIGRVYVRGDLQVVGILKSSYPLASGGRVTLASNSEVEFQPAGPAGPAVKLPGGFDSGTAEFLAVARTELASQVATPPSVPMNAGVAPAAYQGTGTGAAEGNAQLSLPAFEGNCAVHVTVSVQPALNRATGQNSPRYLVNVTGLGNSGPELNPGIASATQRVPFEAASRHGVTVVAFDYAAVRGQPAPRSVNVRIYNRAGLDPNAVVLVRGADQLVADLSIVTPHPIVISGDFNVQPVNGVIPAASLVTAQGVQTETEADAVWAQEAFGAALSEPRR